MVSFHSDNWSVSGIEFVLFDKDGTLIDSHLYWGRIIEKRAWALIRHYSLSSDLLSGLCRAMGYSLAEKKLQQEGPIALVSRDEVIDIVHQFLLSCQTTSTVAEIAELFVQEHKQFLPEMFDYIKLLPSVMETLASLKGNDVRTAVVTTDTMANTYEALRQLDIDRYFDAVIGKESTPEPKITGKPALEALRLLHGRPESAVCIGDAPMDLIMAKNSGLKAGIGIATGQIPISRLQEFTPYVAVTLHDLSLSPDKQERQ